MVDLDSRTSTADHQVIIVGCHALYHDDKNNYQTQREWVGVPPYLHECDVIHQLVKAVEYANLFKSKLLVLSGGYTRQKFAKDSEAETAIEFLKERKLITTAEVIAERFARDTAENLFFGLCCAWENLKVLPDSISLLSFDLKETRMALVNAAMASPVPYKFLGVNTPFSDKSELYDDVTCWRDREAENLAAAQHDALLRTNPRFTEKRKPRTPKQIGDKEIKSEETYFDLARKEYPIAKDLITAWEGNVQPLPWP